MATNNEVLIQDQKSTRVRFAPLELEKAPQVAALLDKLGLGAFDPDEMTSHVGRNDNWSGPTTSGARVFVKQLGGVSFDEARQRFNRILSFETLSARHPADMLTGPRFLGHDADTLMLAYELLPDAQSGAELAADDRFDEALSRRAGQIVAILHDLPPEPDVLDTSPHPLPPVGRLESVPLRAFTGATFGELETWRLIQSDKELGDALRRMREQDAALEDRRPIHADLRLDQFLHTSGQLYLTDWEELRLGDPARDVGAFIGEWLYLAVHGIPKAIGNDRGFMFGHETTHEEILTHGVQQLNRVRPQMAAFWAGYCETRTTTMDGLRTRAAAFAGWHLIDRLFATAIVGGRVPAGDRASAGIGRTILLSADSFTDVLGLGEQR